MKQQSNSITTLDKKSVKVELDNYLCEPCIDYSLQWWHKRGFNKYLCISVLAKEFLSTCALSYSSERLFSAGRKIITF